MVRSSDRPRLPARHPTRSRSRTSGRPRWLVRILRSRRKPGALSEGPTQEHHHRDIRGGGARAAVFGISDGLVTNISLILGLSGASPPAGVVRLAGLAGLLGGAFSMAAGEYVSMRAQTELFERELERERQEIHYRPEGELQELVRIYESRGISSELAKEVARQMMADPQTALETHAREELGIQPGSLGKPVQAALASFATFSVGAVLPLIPFLSGHGTSAVLASIVIAAIAAMVVGSALSLFTGRSWWWSAFRQLAICAAAGAVTYGVGAAVGLSAVH
ncbi:MAG: VIT1/CCC1 transporter family protein [Acidimicrobiales bacterium]